MNQASFIWSHFRISSIKATLDSHLLFRIWVLLSGGQSFKLAQLFLLTAEAQTQLKNWKIAILLCRSKSLFYSKCAQTKTKCNSSIKLLRTIKLNFKFLKMRDWIVVLEQLSRWLWVSSIIWRIEIQMCKKIQVSYIDYHLK